MKLAIRCKHCGTSRGWEKGADQIVRSEQTLGPYGVGHYPFHCAVSPSGMCEPREESSGDRMTRELAEGARRRVRGIARARR